MRRSIEGLGRGLVWALIAPWAAARQADRIEFEPNLGRWPAEATFYAHAPGISAWVRDGGLFLALVRSQHEGAALRLNWGGDAPRAEDEVCRTVTHLNRADKSSWSSTDRVWQRVRVPRIAEGCDLVLREGRGLEYDLELAPGARVEDVVVACEGYEVLWIAPDGSLVIETAAGALVQPPPTSWQVRDGAREPLECRYRLLGPGAFGFELPGRERLLAAVIDPALRWSTYVSGSGDQWISDIAPGPNGTAVVCGRTLAIDFPVSVGAFDPFYSGGIDAFVSCLANDGTQLLWSTYLGGSADDEAVSLAVDAFGAVTVGGTTKSSDFPTSTGALDTSLGGTRDGFVVRLAGAGTQLVWGTYLGGTLEDSLGDLALAPNGEVVAVGNTRGSGFPATAGAYDTTYNGGPFFGDAFALRLAADGASATWSTYLGSSGEELAQRVALGANGQVTLSGTAYSSSFPLTPGAFDTQFSALAEPFVARFAASGAQLLWSTFLGASAEDSIASIAVRPGGSVVCVGQTTSPDFPVPQNALDGKNVGASEGFAVEISNSGSQLLGATYVGGQDEDAAVDVALEPSGIVIVAGSTLSNDLLTTPGAYDRTFELVIGSSGEHDLFVQRLDANLGKLQYATYFGGPGDDRLAACALDASGAILLAGTTVGPNFPVSANAFQPTWNITAMQQGFASRLEFLLHPIPFGPSKLNSGGAVATIRYGGFPSVTDADFEVGIDLALPNEWCYVFRSLQPTNLPFVGGQLLLAPPFARYPRFKSDFLGYGVRSIPLQPWMVGNHLYFQVFYDDPGDSHGASLTNALDVLVHP